MHSAGGYVFRIYEDYEDSESLHEIAKELFAVFSTSGFEEEVKQVAEGVIRPVV